MVIRIMLHHTQVGTALPRLSRPVPKATIPPLWPHLLQRTGEITNIFRRNFLKKNFLPKNPGGKCHKMNSGKVFRNSANFPFRFHTVI